MDKRQILNFLGFDLDDIPGDAVISFDWFSGAPESWNPFGLASVAIAILLGVVCIYLAESKTLTRTVAVALGAVRMVVLLSLLAIFPPLGASAAIIYGVFYMYRREIKTCPHGVAIALAVSRTVVFLALLFVVYLGPAVVYSQKRTVQPYVLIVVDDSASMGRKDNYLESESIAPVMAATGKTAEQIRKEMPSRHELLESLLNSDDGKFFEDLKAKGKLKLLALHGGKNGGETRRSPADADNTNNKSFRLNPHGEGTYLAKGIREALKSVAGSPVAGIVLISDGQDTSKDDDPAQEAKKAATRGVGIYAVAVGDSSAPRNIRVFDLVAEEQVWEGDPFELDAVISAEGVGQQSLEVVLTEARRETPDVAVEIGRKAAPIPAEGGQVSVTFSHSQKKVGKYIYRIAVAPREHETDVEDNSRSTPIEIKKDKSKVLLIAGGPSWEYRMVQAMLSRDKQFDLSVWLQSMDPNMAQEGNSRIDQMPFERKELEDYDVIALFDPDPSEFSPDWIKDLTDYVEDGGGLLYMAGPKYASKYLGLYRGMGDLLPVQLDDGFMELDDITARYTQPWDLSVVPANIEQPIMRFTTDSAFNQERWNQMPPMFWSFPVQDAKPSARVLLEREDKERGGVDGRSPLLVTGQFGAGRTVFMGFNGTWRWRRVGRDAEYFEKFWIQTIRYLVQGRLSKGRRRGLLELNRKKYSVGEPVTIHARLLNRAREPLVDPTITARLKSGKSESTEVQLKAIEGRPGEYEAVLRATHLGVNEISVELEGDKAGETLRIAQPFSVELPAIETRDPRLNRPLLKEIAEVSGGKYYEINQLNQVALDLPLRDETIVHSSKPMPLWDNKYSSVGKYLMILLIVLLSVEWAVRKMVKLM